MPRPALSPHLAVLAILAASAPATAAPPTDAEVRRMLVTRVDAQRQATGIVVGIVAPDGPHVIAYGTRGLDDKHPVDADTVFEVGSITKLFTALLLADLATRGQVKLDDPVARYLPDSVHLPERDHRAITLGDLVTHTAGLPLRPGNLVSRDPENKYAGYTTALLYQFLAGFELPRAPGAAYEYSNVGYGLLGVALSRKLHQSFADAVQARIAGPLGLRDTRLTLTRAMQARAAHGYTLELAPAPHWDYGDLEAAGALRSTARDLMRLLEAQLGYRKTPLHRALTSMLELRRPGGMEPAQLIAMGWNLQRAGDHEIAWKNGSVGGFRTFLGFDATARLGVVVLTNAQTPVGGDDIGLHILDPSSPVDLHVPTQHTAITLAPAALDRFVGRYKFSDTDTLVVSREGAQLYGLSPGADRYPLYPESDHDVFLKVLDAQITFVLPPGGGPATAAIWHQGGQDQRGARVP